MWSGCLTSSTCLQGGLAGQEEEEQNEAMNAMVPTQLWDENGPLWNAPMSSEETPIALGEESTAREASDSNKNCLLSCAQFCLLLTFMTSVPLIPMSRHLYTASAKQE